MSRVLLDSNIIIYSAALVAATALVHNLTVCTRNASDFTGLPGLKLIEPYMSP